MMREAKLPIYLVQQFPQECLRAFHHAGVHMCQVFRGPVPLDQGDPGRAVRLNPVRAGKGVRFTLHSQK